MTYLRPQLWTDALAQRASNRSAVVVAGGTDLMPVINLTLHRPPIILDLSRVTEIASHEERDGYLWIGATTTCTEIAGRLTTRVPALAQAARALGRHRSEIGQRSAGTWDPPPRLGTAIPRFLHCEHR
jgi:CO/xanthine dehydrogenase FAD-binding subunit